MKINKKIENENHAARSNIFACPLEMSPSFGSKIANALVLLSARGDVTYCCSARPRDGHFVIRRALQRYRHSMAQNMNQTSLQTCHHSTSKSGRRQLNSKQESPHRFNRRIRPTRHAHEPMARRIH